MTVQQAARIAAPYTSSSQALKLKRINKNSDCNQSLFLFVTPAAAEIPRRHRLTLPHQMHSRRYRMPSIARPV